MKYIASCHGTFFLVLSAIVKASFRRFFFLGSLLTLAFVPLRGAVLINEYALRGNLNDNLGGTPLTSLGGQITSLGYVFAANQGLSLSIPFLSFANFSIELSFKFDAVTGYRKIADFKSLVEDMGFYVLNGSLNFFPVATATQTDFTPGTNVVVALTRDGATGIVTGYVNGQQRFSFLDNTTLAVATPGVPSNLILFKDDTATGGNEASGGQLNYLRVFNGALTSGQVSALYAGGAPQAVPEPTTLLLLMLGGPVVFALARRRSV